MDTQNGHQRALEEMGFSKDKTAVNEWRLSERAVLEEIANRHGFDIKQPEKSNRKYLEVDEYKEVQQAIEVVETQLENFSWEVDNKEQRHSFLIKENEELTKENQELINLNDELKSDVASTKSLNNQENVKLHNTQNSISKAEKELSKIRSEIVEHKLDNFFKRLGRRIFDLFKKEDKNVDMILNNEEKTMMLTIYRENIVDELVQLQERYGRNRFDNESVANYEKALHEVPAVHHDFVRNKLLDNHARMPKVTYEDKNNRDAVYNHIKLHLPDPNRRFSMERER